MIITAAPTTHEYVPGIKTNVWAYNNQIPGPTLHANVGDTFRVKFINNLPEPSTLHWHGLELPANMDGSHISQKPVPPGGTFVYEFKVYRAATYWYHSHVKPNEQVEKGLYGAFVVHDPDENKKLQLPEQEKVFLLDDVLLDESHQLVKPLPDDPLKRAAYLTNGRIGNRIIVNGVNQPVIDVEIGKPQRFRFINSANSRFFRLSMPNQDVYRIGGDVGLIYSPQKLNTVNMIKDIHEDHMVISNPDPSLGLLMVPGERNELVWVPKGNVGELISIDTHDFPRGQHVANYLFDGTVDIIADGLDGKNPPQTLIHFRLVAPKQTYKKYELPKILREGRVIEVPKKDHNDHGGHHGGHDGHHNHGNHHSHNMQSENAPLHIMFGHGPADRDGNVMFFAMADMENGVMKPKPMMKLTNETTLNAKVGQTRIIEVMNMSRGIHPFHLHGFPFQWLETEYVDKDHPENNRIVKNHNHHWREFKDTYAVAGRPGFRMQSYTITRFVVEFDDENRAGELVAYGGQAEGKRSGGWMVHCHILEHAAKGMAAWLNLR